MVRKVLAGFAFSLLSANAFANTTPPAHPISVIVTAEVEGRVLHQFVANAASGDKSESTWTGENGAAFKFGVKATREGENLVRVECSVSQIDKSLAGRVGPKTMNVILKFGQTGSIKEETPGSRMPAVRFTVTPTQAI